jgi:hypothetical protein
MSFHIDWNALTGNARLLSQLRAHVQAVLDERVNHKPPGAHDDGTRVYLLELEPGSQPPVLELVAMGVDAAAAPLSSKPNEQGDATTAAAQEASGSAAASSADSGSDSEAPHQPPSHLSHSQLLPPHHFPHTPLSGRASPFYRSLSASPALSQSMSRSHSFMAGTQGPLSASGSFSRPSSTGPLQRCCSACGGRLPPPAAVTMPPFSLAGRVAYTGDAYVTLQVRRQVNPYTSTKGLMGRLGRRHLPADTMEWPLTVELWLRLGELSIDAQVQLSYTPAPPAPLSATATKQAQAAVLSSSRAGTPFSPLSPAAMAASAADLSRTGTPSAATVAASHYQLHHPHNNNNTLSSSAHFHSPLGTTSSPLPPHSAAPSPAPSPASSLSSSGLGLGGRHSRMGYAATAPSPMPRSGSALSQAARDRDAQGVCRCERPLTAEGTAASLASSGLLSPPRTGSSNLSASMLAADGTATAGVPAASSSSSSAAAPSPAAVSPSSASSSSSNVKATATGATLSFVLAAHPLQHYSLRTALDGSPAGRKLARMADQGVQLALQALIGQRHTIPLPDFSLAHIKQQQQQKQQQAKDKDKEKKVKENSTTATAAIATKTATATTTATPRKHVEQ